MEPLPPRKNPLLKALGLFGLIFSACLLALLVIGGAALLFFSEELLGGRSAAEAWTPSPECNVIGIAVRGPITVSATSLSPEECLFGGCTFMTSSDEVIEYLNEARENDSIKGILIDIESAGGEPVPSEEIAAGIAQAGKPSVAWIRQIAASGAYWVASAADTIVASANSDVGSIGVTMSYLDFADQTEEEGLHFNSLTSAKFKDTGNPYQPLSQEEIDLIVRDLTITHENFVGAIAANRGLAYADVNELADGSTMLGVMAQEKGLVDIIGGHKEAYETLEAQIGEEPVVCWGGL